MRKTVQAILLGGGELGADKETLTRFADGNHGGAGLTWFVSGKGMIVFVVGLVFGPACLLWGLCPLAGRWYGHREGGGRARNGADRPMGTFVARVPNRHP